MKNSILKSITLTTLLCLAVGQIQAGGDCKQNSIVYFDNSVADWDYSHIYYCLSWSDNGTNKYTGYYMSKINNTKLYVHKRTDSDWNGFQDIRMFATAKTWGSTETGNATCGDFNNMKSYGSNVTQNYTGSYSFNANNYYYIKPSSKGSTTSPASISVDYFGNAVTSLNRTITYNYAISTNAGSSYTTLTSGNTPAAVSISSYKFVSSYNSVSTSTASLSANSTTRSTTCTTAYSGATTLTVSNIQSGYSFQGWYNGTTLLSSATSYTYYPTPTNNNMTVTARFIKETTHPTTVSYICTETSATIKTTTSTQVGETTASSITAPAIEGYTFSSWTVGNGLSVQSGTAITSNPITVKSKSSGTYTLQANYTEDLSCEWIVAGGTSIISGTEWRKTADAANSFVKKSGNSTESVAYLSVPISAVCEGDNNKYYQFKIYNTKTDKWYGLTASGDSYYLLKAEDGTAKTLSDAKNIELRAYIVGTYEFKLDYSNATSPKLTVSWPVINQLRIYTAEPADATNTGSFDLTGQSGTEYTITRTLNADTRYKFKVVYNSDYYGFKTGSPASGDNNYNYPVRATDNENWRMYNADNGGGDSYIVTTVSGQYTFTFNSSNSSFDNNTTLSVSYPDIPDMKGSISLAYNTTDYNQYFLSGAGTETDPYLVYEGKPVYLLATHSSAPANDAHFYYQFNHNGTAQTAQVSSSATTSAAAKKFSTTATGLNETKYVEVSAYYEYGPTNYTTRGTAITSNRVYYKVVQCPTVTLAALDDVEKTAEGGSVSLSASTDIHGTGATLSAKPYYFMVKPQASASYANVLGSATSTSSPCAYSLTTAGTYSFYAYIEKDGYTWYSDTITMKYYIPITVTVKTPSSVWGNVMLRTWSLGFGEDPANVQATWLADVTEGGTDYKYFTYTIKTTGTANFLLYNGDFNGGNQTADISITTDKCYEILNSLSNSKRAYKEMDECAAFYRVKSVAGEKTFYSNVSQSDGDTLSYFASSTGTLSLEKLTSGWSKVRDLAAPADSYVYIAVVDAGTDNVKEVQKYTGDYYIHTNICAGQNPDWKHYPQMTEAERDSARMTYFEPNDNYPNELYNHYWVRFVGTDLNVNAQVGNKYNMYLAEEIGAWPPYTDANTGKPIKAANIRFGYDPRTNWFGRNFIAGSSASATEFVSAYAKNSLYQTDGTTPIDSLNYVKFDDISNWMYQLDVIAIKSGSSYPQVIVRSGYGKETPLFGEGITQNILGSGTTDGTYYMRLIYDYKTNRIIAGWIPDDEEIGSITLEGNLLIQRTMNGDANHVLVSSGNEVVEVKQIYTVLTFDRDSVWTKNGPDKNGYYYFWVSLPYKCFVSDIFGIPGYGTTWTMQRYRGNLRAQQGWFRETTTFWHDMIPDNAMQPGQGYVLRLKKDAISFKEIGGRATVRLFFPSMFEYKYSIAPSSVNTQEVKEYICTITRGDRGPEDSNWNVIGVPGFSDNAVSSYTDIDETYSKEAAPKFYYQWSWDASAKAGKYTVQPVTGTTFRFTHAYMLQYGGTITWNKTYSVADRELLDAYKSAPKHLAAAEPKANRMLALTLSSSTEQDITFVDLSGEGTEAYDLNLDLSKALTTGALQLYTLGAERQAPDGNGETISVISRFAGNCLPDKDITVPVGVQVPQDGEYTFAANKDELNGLIPVLYDKQEDRLINLLFDTYTATLTAGTNEERFSLRMEVTAPTTPTAVENTASGYSLTQVAGGFVLNGIEGTASVQLYDALGRLLTDKQVSQGERIEVTQTGVYVVRVNGTPLRTVLR